MNVFAAGAILVLIIFANLRGLQTARKLEATTSIALAVIILLGVLGVFAWGLGPNATRSLRFLFHGLRTSNNYSAGMIELK